MGNAYRRSAFAFLTGSAASIPALAGSTSEANEVSRVAAASVETASFFNPSKGDDACRGSPAVVSERR